MRIDILTLFPSMFEGFLNTSIIKRARDKKLVEINIIDFREYSKDKDTKVILLTPNGSVYNQEKARNFKNLKHIILICGHYEGFDERITTICDYQISIGDYILTGGEIASMAITDSVVRLIDGVITEGSLETESFNDNLLDYETYTKPYEYNGLKVPDVLISGDHKKIDEFRKNSRYNRTKEIRPDLLDKK